MWVSLATFAMTCHGKMERSNHSKVWKHFAQNDDQAIIVVSGITDGGEGVCAAIPGRLNVKNGLPCWLAFPYLVLF